MGNFNQIVTEEQANLRSSCSNLARRLQQVGEVVIRLEGGEMPPWQTLRTWAKDAMKASREGTGCDLDQRWADWQRRNQMQCPAGHLMDKANTYNRKRRDSRTGALRKVRVCRTCALDRAKATRNKARREGRQLTRFLMSKLEARDMGEYLFYRRSRTWLGDSIVKGLHREFRQFTQAKAKE
jgi:hypothetical protein